MSSFKFTYEAISHSIHFNKLFLRVMEMAKMMVKAEAVKMMNQVYHVRTLVTHSDRIETTVMHTLHAQMETAQ